MAKPNYYRHVPKGIVENLEFRLELRDWASKSRSRQHEIWCACSRDFLFWLNTFCWLFEPRREEVNGKLIPFLSYTGYQDDCLENVRNALGRTDIKIEKSRDTGGTWMVLYAMLHSWLFEPMSTFGLVSRNEDAVDKTDDTDTLMWKLDFAMHHPSRAPQGPGFPRWMLDTREGEDVNRSKNRLVNKRNGSRFFGYAATGDVASGGRKKAMLFDEFSKFAAGEDYYALGSSQFVSSSRIFLSTPSPAKGASGAFYDVVNETNTRSLSVVLDWRSHPDRGRGLYRSKSVPTAGGGSRYELEIVNDDVDLELMSRLLHIPLGELADDEELGFSPGWDYRRDYNFILDGKERSPYYDIEESRPGATTQILAVELNRDYVGAGDPYLKEEEIRHVRENHLRQPTHRGELDFGDDLEANWISMDNGRMLLWLPLDPHGLPPHASYAVGGDISAGTAGDYSSNSSLVAFNVDTGEQVGRIASNAVPPHEWADLAVAFCRWLHDAQLNWEDMGSTGKQFAQRVMQIGYANLYMREVVKRTTKTRTKKPGFQSNATDKGTTLGPLRSAVGRDEAIIRDEWTLDELRQYRYKDGMVVHTKAVNPTAESAAKSAHGDLAIGAAIGWIAVESFPQKRRSAKKKSPDEQAWSEERLQNPEDGTLAWRWKQRRKRLDERRTYF